MNKTLVVGIVVVLAVAVVGWWYYAMMPKTGDSVVLPPEESVNGVATPNEDVAASIAGTWESTEDTRFTRSFTANGTVTDRYAGMDEATISGTWSFVADPSKEQAELPVVKDAKILKIQFPEEVLYFALQDLTATDLRLLYLTGNGTLEFKRK